jgi:hypothetical protein
MVLIAKLAIEQAVVDGYLQINSTILYIQRFAGVRGTLAILYLFLYKAFEDNCTPRTSKPL